LPHGLRKIGRLECTHGPVDKYAHTFVGQASFLAVRAFLLQGAVSDSVKEKNYKADNPMRMSSARHSCMRLLIFVKFHPSKLPMYIGPDTVILVINFI